MVEIKCDNSVMFVFLYIDNQYFGEINDSKLEFSTHTQPVSSYTVSIQLRDLDPNVKSHQTN